MMTPTLPLASPWMAVSLPDFPTLDRDVDVDVLIVGAGLTGVTTAYLMSLEGVRVALIDRDKVAGADTGRTTAHLTYVTDQRIHELAERFGEDGARLLWKGGAVAIDTVEGIAAETAAHSASGADFKRVPGYLHAPIGRDVQKEMADLKKDAAIARAMGFDATLVDRTPHGGLPGVRFAEQARFNPRGYLQGLLAVIRQRGGLIFEHTTLESCEDGSRMVVTANGRKIRCDYLVIATHNPLMGKRGAQLRAIFAARLTLYTSYVLGARMPAGATPEGLYWDTNDPYEYLRVDDRGDHQYAIFGGADVPAGQERDADEVFGKLQARMREVLPHAKAERRWMGQVVVTDDGMPFIGENDEREFIATGYCGNGFTLGTLSAMMARDRFLKRDNPWFGLLACNRLPFHAGKWRHAHGDADFPYHFGRDRPRP